MTRTIKVDDDVHKELSKLGTFGETYNNIIKRLVRYWKENKK